MPGPLSGQAAIVTGAATGIGSAIARELGARGAMVAVNYLRRPEAAADIARDIEKSGSRAIAVQGDVSKPEDVTRIIAETVAAFGRLDIMIANAGIQVDAPSLTLTPEQWDQAIHVDLRGQFLCAQGAAKQFLTQQRVSRAAGKIVCMLSVHDRIPWAGHVNYAAAKAGAYMMMQTLAQEWAPLNIRVVGISPGAIKTDINRKVWEEETSRRELLKLIPYQRLGEVEDVAKVTAWLVSDEADYITGSTIYVDGGMMLYPGFADNG